MTTTPPKYIRRVIRIRATDSPNVQRGLKQRANGVTPDDMVVIPGVITYGLYRKRMRTWDKIRRTIGLHAQFYLGAELLLFPPDWLDHSEELALELLNSNVKRQAISIGADVARGGDSTSFYGVDWHGVVDKETRKTPDSSKIKGSLLAFARRLGVPDSMCFLDSGGGGGQIYDELKSAGHRMNLVYFGGTPVIELKRAQTQIEERRDIQEDKFTYKNLRAQMYHDLSVLMDPNGERGGFAIPAEYERLRRELSPIPKLYDGEGRIVMLPKDLDTSKKEANEDRVKSLKQLIGWSPDEADALVLAVHGLLKKKRRPRLSGGSV